MGANLEKQLDKAQKEDTQDLDLCGKGISSVPANIGGLENLKRLNLGNNKLSTLPTTIGDLRALVRLKLFNNKLVELPQEITNLHNLEELNLSVNKLPTLPRGFGSFNHLMYHIDNCVLTLLFVAIVLFDFIYILGPELQQA